MEAHDLYQHVREREGHLYSDELVLSLPKVPLNHPWAREWIARADSSARLVRYLSHFSWPLLALELGCGNGWLSHKLAEIPRLQVWGLDRGELELSQAARLFTTPNLAFLNADVFRAPFPDHTFDLIVLASVIQYFPDLSALIQTLRALLAVHGEIHILDSPLYDENQAALAAERTRAYYVALGFPDMAGHYFHHTLRSLDQFSPSWIYRPNAWHNRLGRRFMRASTPFAWLCIRREH
jgi:SAM-dependent methyltransferase